MSTLVWSEGSNPYYFSVLQTLIQKATSMNNLEIVQQLYQNFATGNVPAVLAAFKEDIQWFECKGMPMVEDNGHFIGPDAVLQQVFMKIGEYIDGFAVKPMEFVAEGNKVVMVGYYLGTNKATGNAFRAQAAHVWTMENGKCSSFFQAVDTAAIIA